MKLGIAYNLFNGFELLEASARTIREEVDYILVVNQNISNRGNRFPDYLNNLKSKIIKGLISDGIIDEVIEYVPDLKADPGINEAKKRQIGYNRCLELGYTHHMSLDVDEIYNPIDLKRAKEIYINSNTDVSFVHIADYYGDFNHLLWDLPKFLTSFIVVLDPNKNFNEKGIPDGFVIDPSRYINGDNILVFDREIIKLHHMSHVRLNGECIASKWKNRKCNEYVTDEDIDEVLKYYDEWDKSDKQYGKILQNFEGKAVKDARLTYVNNDWIKESKYVNIGK